jgi:16S rRNA (guanine966-N2)-methyltransferase
LGGRVLRAPKGSSTRPTSDRVREALFQVLGDLTGARVLDCYAGTGALGIEAASRGAVRVTFVEANRGALGALRANLEALGLSETTKVIPTAVERAGGALGSEEPFDLVLVDPPWAGMDQALIHLQRLLRGLPLAAGARVVVEHAARSPLRLPPGWNLAEVDRRAWGDTAVSIFQHEG